MVEKIKDKLRKVWNILNGSDKNMDGKVDIDDAMLAAERKTKAHRIPRRK
jgi:hypothetical protein